MPCAIGFIGYSTRWVFRFSIWLQIDRPNDGKDASTVDQLLFNVLRFSTGEEAYTNPKPIKVHKAILLRLLILRSLTIKIGRPASKKSVAQDTAMLVSQIPYSTFYDSITHLLEGN